MHPIYIGNGPHRLCYFIHVNFGFEVGGVRKIHVNCQNTLSLVPVMRECVDCFFFFFFSFLLCIKPCEIVEPAERGRSALPSKEGDGRGWKTYKIEYFLS